MGRDDLAGERGVGKILAIGVDRGIGQ